ncbi:MAG: EamA family transporter [DPANN group archaeon]|nr:EamA family transporter [DPANN group archaeon]
MSYVIFAVLGALLIGAGAFYRKVALKNIEPSVAALIESTGSAIISWVAVLLFGVSVSLQHAIWPLAGGFFTFLAIMFVYTALKTGPVSTITTIYNLNAVIAVPLGILLLGETLNSTASVGILLSIIVIFLVYSPEKIRGGAWLLHAIGAMASFGIMNYFIKSSADLMNPLLGFAILSTSTLLFLIVYNATMKAREIRKVKSAALKDFAIVSVLLSLGVISIFRAFALGPLSVVVPIANMNLIPTVFLSALVLKEKLDKKTWLAIALALPTVWLLSI